MVLTRPYPLATLADRLPITSVEWDIQRNDELSGVGSGQIWPAELADPLWMANVVLWSDRTPVIKQIAALIRALHGSQEAFWLYDPLSKYPAADPDGSILGTNSITISSRGTYTITLQGLPLGYKITLGDKMQIAYGSGPVRYAFLEASESVTEHTGDTKVQVETFPHPPAGIKAGDPVTLIRPACRCVIVPGSFKPGTARRHYTEGATFRAIQKR